MYHLDKIVNYVRTYGLKHKQLYAISLMLFFWAIFDGILSFITPLYITQQGISEGLMGIIIGTSSIAGILFDLLLCRILKDTRFRVVYLVMFIICFVYPFVLYQGNTAFLFIIAMAMWGLYYDLINLGNYDFIARTTDKKENATSFAVMRIFFDLGYLIAPLLAGFLIVELVDFKSFFTAWIFLIISLFCYFLVLLQTKKLKNGYHSTKKIKLLSIFKELALWKKIGNFILPVLIVTLVLNITDAIYWTIGPLLSASTSFLGDFGGLFMMVYILPPLFVGWFVGSATAKYGKKRTAFFALFAGSFCLSLFYFFRQPILLVFLSFVSSFFTSFTSPAIAGAYADYIQESPEIEKEINTMQDSFTNLGYVIGPIIAGFAGQYFGHINSFSLLGLLGMIVAVVLMIKTPKHIKIKIKQSI